MASIRLKLARVEELLRRVPVATHPILRMTTPERAAELKRLWTKAVGLDREATLGRPLNPAEMAQLARDFEDARKQDIERKCDEQDY